MTFSPQIWEHFKNPHGRGRLDNYTGEGWAGSRQAGLFMRFQILITDDIVEDAAFETVGCLTAIASGSYLVQWARGRPITDLTIDPAQIDQALGGLPPEKRSCAEMAAHALKRAVEDAQRKETS